MRTRDPSSAEQDLEIQVARQLASCAGVPFVDLREYDISPGILRRIPKELAETYRCVPVVCNHRRVVLAHAAPADAWAFEAEWPTSSFRLPDGAAPRRVEFCLTTASALDEALTRRAALPD